jgi:ABC-type proline/glycine betaine transport system substrate-binding protein
METKMKTIMGALAAGLLLAGTAAPASADTEELIEVVREYVRVPTSEPTRDVIRRYLPEQIEYQADKLPVGSSEWWQQMDRERRGGRR